MQKRTPHLFTNIALLKPLTKDTAINLQVCQMTTLHTPLYIAFRITGWSSSNQKFTHMDLLCS